MKSLIVIPFTFSICSAIPGTTSDSEASSTDEPSTTTTSSTSTTDDATTWIETTEVPTTGEPCPVGALGCPCTGGGGCDRGLSCDADMCVEGFSPPCDPSVNMDDCCGDGVLDEFEDCDMGLNWNDDAGECTTRCRHATCGDGMVLAGIEACDGDEDCTAECTLKSCGNGVLDDPREWCEPTGDGDPECTHLCGDARKIIFVSSEHYKGGEIGGLAGGDEKCQALADAEGLTGTFKVWLATSKEDAPLVRFSWSDVPYVDVNGEVIAETWTEIYATENDAPLITEQGFQVAPSEQTWPWTDPVVTRLVAWASALNGPGGPLAMPITCGEWSDTAESGPIALLDPNPDVYMSGTFKVATGGACHLAAPIICVEQ